MFPKICILVAAVCLACVHAADDEDDWVSLNGKFDCDCPRSTGFVALLHLFDHDQFGSNDHIARKTLFTCSRETDVFVIAGYGKDGGLGGKIDPRLKIWHSCCVPEGEKMKECTIVLDNDRFVHESRGKRQHLPVENSIDVGTISLMTDDPDYCEV